MKEAVELAKIPVPVHLFPEACAEDGYRPGGTVHRLNDRLKRWLMREIWGCEVDYAL